MYERSKLEWRSDGNQTRRVGESMRALSFAYIRQRVEELYAATTPSRCITVYQAGNAKISRSRNLARSRDEPQPNKAGSLFPRARALATPPTPPYPPADRWFTGDVAVCVVCSANARQ
jgi:hypothetical protein